MRVIESGAIVVLVVAGAIAGCSAHVAETDGGAATDAATGDGGVVCPPGATACGGACIDIQSSADDCGGCGRVCPQGFICTDSVCTVACIGAACPVECDVGLLRCSPGCVDPMTDSTNCGGCGHVCAVGRLCRMGLCATPSPP